MPDSLLKQASQPSALNIRALLGSILMTAGLVVFLGTIALIGGSFAYTSYLKGDIAEKTAELEAAEKGFEASALRQSIDRDRKLQALQDLLRGHLVPSNTFVLLQENTLPQVRFVVFAYTAESRRIDLSGEAQSYSVLADQVRVFESQPAIERVDFGGLTLGEKGLLNFKMSLMFRQNLLQFK